MSEHLTQKLEETVAKHNELVEIRQGNLTKAAELEQEILQLQGRANFIKEELVAEAEKDSEETT